MNKKFLIIIFSLVLFATKPMAAPSKARSSADPKTPLPVIYAILKNYQKQSAVQMNVAKIFIQKMLGRKTHSSGQFILSKTKWRYDTNSPEKTHIIYNGKSILFCRLKTKEKHTLPGSKAPLLALLFDDREFHKNFKYEKSQIKGRTAIYSFFGLRPDSPQKIFIQIEKDRILTIRILWKPPLGEEFYQFSSIQFNPALKPNIFSHICPI